MPSPTKAINDGHVYLPNVVIANVRSLSGKVDELSVIAKVNDVDIICMTNANGRQFLKLLTVKQNIMNSIL